MSDVNDSNNKRMGTKKTVGKSTSKAAKKPTARKTPGKTVAKKTAAKKKTTKKAASKKTAAIEDAPEEAAPQTAVEADMAQIKTIFRRREDVRDVAKAPFALSVGTIESRKNCWRMAQAWQQLSRAPGLELPKLVFAGRRGWLNDDFLDAYDATGGWGGWVRILEQPSDDDLAFLYERCDFTIARGFLKPGKGFVEEPQEVTAMWVSLNILKSQLYLRISSATRIHQFLMRLSRRWATNDSSRP